MGERAVLDGGAESAEAGVRAASLALAIVQNDAAAIGAILADGWHLVDADGPTNRTRFLELAGSRALIATVAYRHRGA